MALGWFYAEWGTWSGFVTGLTPTAASMVATSLINVICMVLVARAGDVWSVSVFGLSNFFIALVASPLASTLAEVTGIFFSLHFGAGRYAKVIDYFYKAILVEIGIVGLLFLLSLQAARLLTLIDVEEDLAQAAGRLVLASNLYVPFMYTNRILCAFMGAQLISRHFYTLTVVSVTLTLVLGYFFVISLDMKEMGMVPTKLAIEVVVLVLNLYYVATRSNPECLGLPDPRTLLSGLIPFLRRIFFVSISVFMNYLTLEFNLYLAALMHSPDDLALWTTYANFGVIFSYLSYAISAVIRSDVGFIVGQGDFPRARRLCIAYYFYVFVISLGLSLAVVLFAHPLASLYFPDSALQQRLVPAFLLYAAFLFVFLLPVPTYAIFRLLGRDAYFFRVIVLLFPLLVVAINTALVYACGLGVTGLYLGNGLSTLAVSLVFLHKLFLTDVWNKSAVPQPSSELASPTLLNFQEGRGSLALLPIEFGDLPEKQAPVKPHEEELLDVAR